MVIGQSGFVYRASKIENFKLPTLTYLAISAKIFIMKILIQNGRVIDPANGFDAQANVLVADGKIISVSPGLDETADEIINADGCWVVPGLIDMHVHLRDPGHTHKETLQTGALAAAAGGFTTICCMPNTSPVIDTAQTVEHIKNSQAQKIARIIPVGSVTCDLAGKELSRILEMKTAGICAISDDGKTVQNTALFTSAMKLARQLNLPVLAHCEPEEEIIARDIALAKEAGVHLHICHVSTAAGCKLIRAAQAAGQKITAEVAPHHFTLTEDDHDCDPNYKMAPPLRPHSDRNAIIAALVDGTISVIATDHAPHHADEKALPYETAANGIIGLETAVPLAISELGTILTPLQLIGKFTANPAKILGLPAGTLSPGAPADITIIDPKARHTIDKAKFASKSRNTPFHGREVTGKIKRTILGGKLF